MFRFMENTFSITAFITMIIVGSCIPEKFKENALRGVSDDEEHLIS
jgi:hypothetical protein